MVQAQDVLGLGSEARMNFPGVEGGGSWRWKLAPGQLTREHAGAYGPRPRRLRACSQTPRACSRAARCA